MIIWLVISGALVTALLASMLFVDHPLALLVKETLLAKRTTDFMAADVPDVLFLFVCIVTPLAWTLYYLDRRRGVRTRRTDFACLVGSVVPLSFIVKHVLKFAFGRIETRYWLLHPGLPEFRWFSGAEHYNGFPSGHMTVFGVFFLAWAKYYPERRPVAIGLLSALGVVLIATDYHYLSDVLAGLSVAFAMVFLYPADTPDARCSRRKPVA